MPQLATEGLELPSDPEKLARIAVGQVVLAQTSEQERVLTFLGSCFAYLGPHTFVTAHHCANLASRKNMFVVSAIPPYLRQVTHVRDHSAADISLLEVKPSAEADEHPFFVPSSKRPQIGDDFVTFGYPPDVFGVGEDPTGRLFKGHFQRFMYFETSWGANYNYVAAELSIPCPGGLSGAPLYRAENALEVVGLITWNLCTTFGDERIEYGVGLRLHEVAQWLKSQVLKSHAP